MSKVKVKPTTHTLKCWPPYFEDVRTGKKQFELRKDDDLEYKVGDILHLREFKPCMRCHGTGRVRDYTDMMNCICNNDCGKYTRRSVKVRVVYRFADADTDLPFDLLGENCVCLGIKLIAQKRKPKL